MPHVIIYLLKRGGRGETRGEKRRLRQIYAPNLLTSCMADSLCHSLIEMPNKRQFTFAFGLLTTLLLAWCRPKKKNRAVKITRYYRV